jgi:Mrp family chromosome partitioning ATPase/uncharacterized protein involved in exopolysaccharide biosynthesis
MLLRKAPFILGFTALTTSVSLAAALFLPFTYKGNFYLLVEPITAAARLSDPSTIARTGGVPSEELTALDYPTNLAFLRGPGMVYQIAQDVYNNKILKKRAFPVIWKEIRENLEVEWIRDRQGADSTKIFAVSFSANSAQEVEAVLTVAADTFVRYSTKDRESSIKAGVKFIDGQLPDLQRNLAALKIRQKQLRERYALVDPGTKYNDLLEELNELSNQKLLLTQKIDSQQGLINKLEAELKLSHDQAIAASIFNQDQERLGLIKKIQDINAQIASVSSTYTENSHQMMTLREQRDNLQTLLDRRDRTLLSQVKTPLIPNSNALDLQDPTRLELASQLIKAQTELEGLTSQVGPLEVKLSRLEAESQQLPKVINQYEAIARDIELTEQVVDKLLLQRETLKVEVAQELPWQVISKPQVPLDENGNPIGTPPPRVKLLSAGVGGGLILSLLLVLLWEKRRNVFYSSEDVQDILGIPLVGEIYRQRLNRLTLPKQQSLTLENAPTTSVTEGQNYYAATATEESHPDVDENRGAIATAQREDAPEESVPPPSSGSGLLRIAGVFEDIYAELSFFYRNPPLRSLMVTAVQDGDGQSTIIINLALAAAAQGRKVLVVDLQPENTGITAWLGGHQRQGVCTLLQEEVALETVVQRFPAYANLDLLSAGQETVMEPLWSADFQYLMSEFQASYDLVLYDLPSFFTSSDLYFIASHTDGLIFTVGIKKTPQHKTRQAVQKANELGLPVIGVITNWV